MPTLSFQFGDGQKYVVDYNLGQANSYYCWSAVMGLDVGVGSNTWLLGTSSVLFRALPSFPHPDDLAYPGWCR